MHEELGVGVWSKIVSSFGGVAKGRIVESMGDGAIVAISLSINSSSSTPTTTTRLDASQTGFCYTCFLFGTVSRL